MYRIYMQSLHEGICIHTVYIIYENWGVYGDNGDVMGSTGPVITQQWGYVSTKPNILGR